MFPRLAHFAVVPEVGAVFDPVSMAKHHVFVARQWRQFIAALLARAHLKLPRGKLSASS